MEEAPEEFEEKDIDIDEYGLDAYVEEEAQVEESFSKICSSSDNSEQLRRYQDYLNLIKEIACQNRVVERLKNDITELCAKPCKTRCEMKEIKEKRRIMEQENIKLCCMISKAMELQNFGSKRHYRDIPIATTFDEDNLEPYMDCIPPCTNVKLGDPESNEPQSTCSESDEPQIVCESSEDSMEEERMRCLCQKLKSMQISCPEDKELVKQIAAILSKSAKCKAQAQSTKDECSKRKEDPCSFSQVEEKQEDQSQPCPKQSPCADEQSKLDKLKFKLRCMQKTVEQLKEEMKKRKPDDECAGQIKEERPADQDCAYKEPEDPLCSAMRTTKADQLNKMKENYVHLLSEFSRKDAQVKELEKRLKGFCGGCGNIGKSDDQDDLQRELHLLRTQANELQEEQVEFKCLMKEQQKQLEEYRTKYLSAQQKAEEQAATLEKLNLNNKRIEKQINNEVKEIRAKFQEKLNELVHFPKLLENEQLKLAQCYKEKENLQSKLALICKELQTLKEQKPDEADDCRPQLLRCQREIMYVQEQIEEVEQQRDLYCEELVNIKDDLGTLRSESTKIIARTKERAELMRQKLQDRIDQLERELAQCRASACVHVTDRESAIREMQGQLNSLSFSFDAAQKQIKTLRNQIAYVSNENCSPVKC